MNSFERETVINSSDGDELVRIWTAQRRYITKMRRDARFTEVRSGVYEDSEFAEFTIPAVSWSPIGAKRVVTMTSAQRIAAATRLAEARARKGG